MEKPLDVHPESKAEELIEYLMYFGRWTREQAIAHADKHCGEWCTTPVPQAKHFESIASDEEEIEE
ncbi:hypothetical protein B4926_11845 [Vibrio cholerae]|uniref:hypothetical protein n=1 Tax=Vibrio cholerae TaxID=666 RepID=UPI001E4744BA|nr:hypothetical protein [Vibrio cholerae]EJL7011377.1 hypothetical protein [Vibrio cholerae]MCD1223062.1 hypothetical protein [Vibrio cholerae]MCD1252187.1 hypothetical protein [Vibrio cholerae]